MAPFATATARLRQIPGVGARAAEVIVAEIGTDMAAFPTAGQARESRRRDRKAATAIEYGLIVALIVIAMIGGLRLFAGTTINMWNNVSTTVLNNA